MQLMNHPRQRTVVTRILAVVRNDTQLLTKPTSRVEGNPQQLFLGTDGSAVVKGQILL